MNKDRRKKVNALQDLLQAHGLSDAITKLEEIKDKLEEIRDEEEAAFDNLPESLQTDDAIYPLTQLNEALQKIEGVIESIDMDDLDEAFSALEEAKGPAED